MTDQKILTAIREIFARVCGRELRFMSSKHERQEIYRRHNNGSLGITDFRRIARYTHKWLLDKRCYSEFKPTVRRCLFRYGVFDYERDETGTYTWKTTLNTYRLRNAEKLPDTCALCDREKQPLFLRTPGWICWHCKERSNL